MPAEQTFVIIGASLAGAKAAQTLREEGFDGAVAVVGEETEPPYERPPLSKGYLLGKQDKEKAHVHDADWYRANQVDLRLGVRAGAVDRAAHMVELSGGERLRYDKLLLATGASPRRLPVPGGDLPGVHYLRRMDDSTRLREALRGGGARVVVVGAGWIGLEVAAAARTYGNTVTVVEPEAAPLIRVLGPEVGKIFADLHRRHEVDLRLGVGVTELAGADTVDTVVTADGTRLPADVVVVGIGAVPNVELAQGSGLEVDNGVVVDAALRTADPDVYAAGDVANAFNPLFGRRIRVEHWANALNGGPAAARSMLGQEVTYNRVPYFYTDQYELGMEYSGLAGPGEYDRVVFRGDVDGLEFIAFWLQNGRVLAGMNVNVWDVTGDIQALIRSGHPVEVDRLTDPAVPLGDLAGKAGKDG